MRSLKKSSRSGAALLVVLASLVVVLAASTILVRAAAEMQSRHRIGACTMGADYLLTAAEAPIQDWLDHLSAKVVLPPEVDEVDGVDGVDEVDGVDGVDGGDGGAGGSQVEVLHDAWMIGDLHHELIITAWDQCGMIPLELIQGGSVLRLVVPMALMEQCDAVSAGTDPPNGLDSYIYIDASEPARCKSPFPQARPGSAVGFGNLPSPVAVQAKVAQPALGAFVATRTGQQFQINVNTAPIALLESLFQTAQRGGIDQIITARRQGKPAPAGGQVTDGSGRIIQIVASSSIWSFRIDTQVGPVRKSWWAVYVPSREKGNRHTKTNSHQWECVQRLVIGY